MLWCFLLGSVLLYILAHYPDDQDNIAQLLIMEKIGEAIVDGDTDSTEDVPLNSEQLMSAADSYNEESDSVSNMDDTGLEKGNDTTDEY